LEELLQQGIKGLRNGQYSLAYSTAKSLGISETTLRERYQGRKSRQDGHVSEQLLSDSEENTLAKWITTLTLTELPPSYSIIETMADAIRADRVVSVNTPSNQFDTSLITSSPPNAAILQSKNNALNDMMDKNAPHQTPIPRYVKCLTKTAERLRAQNSILTQQNKELQDIIRARREHKKGRQVVLEGQIVLTTKELTDAVIDIDNRAKKKKEKKTRRKPEIRTTDSASESNVKKDICEEPPMKKRWILSAVVI